MTLSKRNIFSVWIVLVLFGLIYGSISLVSHYNLRSSAYDLGIFNQAMFDYSNFDLNDNTVLTPHFENLLSDHMCLILIPISFFRYLFGSYTLLIIQVLSVLLGGFGCYKYFKQYSNSHKYALLAMIHFFAFIGIYTALSFDYHNNVVGAMLIPWFFYFLLNSKWWQSGLIALLVISTKENMSLYMAFIALGLLFTVKDKNKKVFLSGVFVFSACYFVLLLEVVMPSLANDGMEYKHFDYAVLGNSWGDGIKNILAKPLLYLKYFFVNHTGNTHADNIKKEFYITFLLCGGFAAVINPRYLLVLGFLLLQKVFNNSVGKWGMTAQYAIELTPIIVFALYELLYKIKAQKLKLGLGVLAATTCAYVTFYNIELKESSYLKKKNIKLYSGKHYQSNYKDLGLIKEKVSELPAKASISAESSILPHLALRDKIYFFPDISDAEYIVLLPNDKVYYPLDKEKFIKKTEEFRSSEDWEVYFENEDILIFKR